MLEVETSRENGPLEDDVSIAEKQSLIGCFMRVVGLLVLVLLHSYKITVLT